MNKLFELCLLVIFGFVTSEVSASQKTEIYYRLNRAWVSISHLYISYEKNATDISYSLLDVNGTVKDEISENLYQRLDKKSKADNSIIDFESGLPSDGLLYADDIFLVHKVNSNVSISTPSGEFTYVCDEALWGGSDPVRFDDKLFYCGHVIPVSGKDIAELSFDVYRKIEIFAQERILPSNYGGKLQVSVCSANSRQLNVSVFDAGGRKGARLDFFKIDIDTLEYAGIQELPFESSEFRVGALRDQVQHLR